MSAIKELWAY
jgi:hypothetical protein